MKPGFSIGGANDGLQVVVRGREYPNLHDFWDGNWLLTPLIARSGGVRFDVPDAMLRADEITAFRLPAEVDDVVAAFPVRGADGAV